MMPRFGKFAVALLNRFLERRYRFGKIIAPEQRQAEMMIRPRVITVALFDGLPVSGYCFGVVATTPQRQPQIEIGIRVIRLLLNGFAKSVNGTGGVARVQKSVRQMIISARKI